MINPWLCIAYASGQDGWSFVPITYTRLTHNQLEMCGCVFSNVATDDLLLKHQTISTHTADEIIFVLDQFHWTFYLGLNLLTIEVLQYLTMPKQPYWMKGKSGFEICEKKKNIDKHMSNIRQYNICPVSYRNTKRTWSWGVDNMATKCEVNGKCSSTIPCGDHLLQGWGLLSQSSVPLFS